jgi:uncharacterized repeat protein (TIGR02543 family)
MKRMISLLLSMVLLLGTVAVAAVPASAKSEFIISDTCVQMIKDMEGFDKYPRWDYSQWTVGHGTRCPDKDLDRYRKNGITYEEADALLREYANSFGNSVNSFVDKHGLKVNQAQFDALLLFTYNFGTNWMVKDGSFRAGLLSGLKGNDFLFEIGQWCHVTGGQILTNLIKRRLIEANMYLNGEYSTSVRENYCYVIYDFNGGDGITDVQCYDSNNPVASKVTPTRSGYTFAGWYTAKTGGHKVTKLDASVRNMKLYARWIEGTNAPVEDETPDISVDDTTKINPVKVTVSANGVNLRKGPGTNYSTCGVVYKGKTLTITETKDATGYTWGKFEGGWIALCFTNYDAVKGQGQEEKPTTQPTEPEQQPDKEDPKKGTMGTVTGNEVRVRSGAGTNYKVLRYHNKGDRVEVFGTKKVGNINWGKLKDGWIAMSYVKLDEKAPEKEPEASKPAEPEAPKPTEPEKDETKVLMTGTVNVNDKLRVRKGPGTSYAVVGSLAAKTRVNIYETKQVGSTTWGRVDEGWISLYYVILDKTETTKPEQSTTIKGTITADCLRVRSGAGTNYKVVGYLYQGAKVEILETKQVGTATWGRIKTGWISMTYVKQ